MTKKTPRAKHRGLVYAYDVIPTGEYVTSDENPGAVQQIFIGRVFFLLKGEMVSPDQIQTIVGRTPTLTAWKYVNPLEAMWAVQDTIDNLEGLKAHFSPKLGNKK